MDGQPTEDKLAVLENIFGNDLTQSVIANALRENNNQFDPTVEKLLTLPANKVNPPQPQPQPQQPMDNKSMENINRLHTMFGDLTQSVITTVYESNKRDVEGTVDTLLNMTSNEVATGAKREAEIARQEQELRNYEEFKQLQQRLQEQERKATEEAQQRVKEAEKKKAEEEAQRKAQHEKKMQDEHAKALQEQERLLLEFQRKKAVEEQAKKAAEEQTKKAAEEQTKKAAEEQTKKAAEEQAKKAAEAQEMAKKADEQEKAKKAAQEQQERERKEAERKEVERIEAERKEAERREVERRELERKKLEEQRREQESAALRAQMLAQTKRIEDEKKKLEEKRLNEERIALKKLEDANLELQKQKQMAEAERKILEARMKEELQREEEERKRFAENERRLRDEQESIKRSWEEKVRKLENERRLEEQMRKEEEAKRAEAKRAEEEERARHEADMRKILELERLKLEEQRKRVEEEKRNAEERLMAMELAAKKREEEEEERKRQEEERKREQEEERKREEEERIRLLEEENQARERLKEEMSKAAAQEQFAASAIMVPPAENEPKVQISAEVDGTEIRGTWTLLEGEFPSPHAWLGLFAKRSINTYTGFQYVNGTSGSFRFKGLTPGHYEVRVFGNKPVTSRVAESATLVIGPQVLSFVAQMQGEHIMFEYKLDPPSVPSTWDWVGIYEKTQRRNKNYLSSTYGNTTGTISAALPRTPGEYQARLFAAGAKYNEQATVEFTVVDNDHVSAELVDGTIKANWLIRTVEPTSSDWIGLFAAGEVSNKYLASVYTHGASAGTIDIPLPKDIPAGTYELRLFSNKVGKYTTFKVSNVITIN